MRLLLRLNSNSTLVEIPPHSAPIRFASMPEPSLTTVLALIGFSAVVGQVVLMRELIVVFNGNEMALGIMLATWLLWTAAGSSVASRLAPEESKTRSVATALQCLLALSLPVSIWALRASKSLFQAVPGELVGPLPMMLACLACLSLFCIFAGALFVTAARMVRQQSRLSSSQAAGSAYMIEAIGSALGGIVASILVGLLEPFQIATIVAVLNLSMAAVLLFRPHPRQLAALLFAAALCALPLLTAVAPALERQAQARFWRGFHLLESRDSIYSNLAATETGDIRSIYSNGILVANVPDPSAAEESVHYALLEHPAPQRVLLIGGGINGSIAEVLKHPTIERIDYVELDPALIGMARQFMPATWPTDPRVFLHYSDGRSYLRASQAKFDVILVLVPDPQTAQLNRFYTVEFFRSARAHLAPGGLLSLELRSSEETIGPDLADFLRCIQHTLEQVYPHTIAIPGDTIHFFAADEPGVLTENPQTLIARMHQRNLQTSYVSQYFIPYRMMPDRMQQVREQLCSLPSTPVNRDFAPIAYYFNIVLWSRQFSLGGSRWFRAAAQIPFATITTAALACLLLAAALCAFIPGRQRRAPAAAIYSVAASGFTLMALQVFLLLAFQSIYGYVYHQLALLIGLGMAGIAFGSLIGIRQKGARSPSLNLATTQVLLAISAPLLITEATLLARLSSPAATWIAAQCVFPALAAFLGMLGGYQFTIAAKICLDESSRTRTLGVLYAIDLLGGSAGALLLSTFLIPVFGFWKTAWLCAAINLVPALLAFAKPLTAFPLETPPR